MKATTKHILLALLIAAGLAVVGIYWYRKRKAAPAAPTAAPAPSTDPATTAATEGEDGGGMSASYGGAYPALPATIPSVLGDVTTNLALPAATPAAADAPAPAVTPAPSASPAATELVPGVLTGAGGVVESPGRPMSPALADGALPTEGIGIVAPKKAATAAPALDAFAGESAFPLKLGSQGPEVRHLQAFLLRKHGAQFPQGISDLFDEATRKATQRFLGRDTVSLAYYQKAHVGQY